MIILVGYIIFMLIIYLFAPFIRRTKQGDFFRFIVLAIVLATIAYMAEPLYDLEKHFGYMYKISLRNTSLLEILFQPIPGYAHNRFYIVFNIFCYIFVKIGNFHLLPATFVLIDYLIFGYITVDYLRKKNARSSLWFISILTEALFIPYLYAVSGLRNALAASLAALAIYYILYKKNKIGCAWVILLASGLIHPATIMVIPFVILAYRGFTLKSATMVIVTLLLANNLASIMSMSSIDMIRMLGTQYLRYTSATQYRNSRRYVIAEIICLSIILLVIGIHQIKLRSKVEKLSGFFLLYIIFIIGNVGNYDMVLRPAYVLGPLSAPMFYEVFETKWIIKRKQSIKIKLIIYIIICACSIWVLDDYLKIFLEYI